MFIATIGTYSERDTGPSRVHHGLATALANRGHRIHIFGYGDRDSHPHANVSVTAYPDAQGSVRAVRAAHQDAIARAETLGVDTIHSLEHHSPGADIATVQWTFTPAALARTGCWAALPAPRAVLGDVLLNVARRRGAAAADTTVATSPVTAAQMRGYWRASPDTTIPLGVPRAACVAPETVTTSDPVRVLFPGRISPKKGQTAVLRHLDPGADAYQVRVVGSKTEAADEDVLDTWRDRCAGYVSRAELDAAYREASVAVVASAHENFGLTALEALARGTLVVVTEACGVAQFRWACPANGVFVVDDARAAARQVHEVATWSQSARRARRRAAAETAREYTWDRIADRYETLYRRVTEHGDTATEALA